MIKAKWRSARGKVNIILSRAEGNVFNNMALAFGIGTETIDYIAGQQVAERVLVITNGMVVAFQGDQRLNVLF